MNVTYEVWVTFDGDRTSRLSYSLSHTDAFHWSHWCLLNGNGTPYIRRMTE